MQTKMVVVHRTVVFCPSDPEVTHRRPPRYHRHSSMFRSNHLRKIMQIAFFASLCCDQKSEQPSCVLLHDWRPQNTSHLQHSAPDTRKREVPGSAYATVCEEFSSPPSSLWWNAGLMSVRVSLTEKLEVSSLRALGPNSECGRRVDSKHKAGVNLLDSSQKKRG
uniref:Uncharacterized protein n=1 Tax=Knipowitschia caucasica TaxID=637954 RepID=A0AAV2LGA1_KNICA